MRRKTISFLLIVSMLFLLTPDTVMAAKVEGASRLLKAAESDPAAMEGDGTEVSPYRIHNAEQLRLFADMVNGVNGTPNTGLCAVLTQNIDLSGVCGEESGSWTPIGTDKNPYTGIFNGGSFQVSGLYCQRAKSSYAGLFGCNNGTIRNLGVTGSVAAGNYTGGVCGRNAGIITGCYSAAAVAGARYTGGICGYNDVTGTVNVCYHTGAVSGSKYVGGICGYNQNDTSSCYNMGTVNGSGTSVGGICGYNKKLVSGCYNTGEVSGKGKKYVGSVCGYNHSKSVFLNCYYLITGTEKGNYGVAMTLQQFASGEVCWLLNDGKSENVVWYQTCGAGFPGFGGKVVYQVQRPKAGGKAGEMILVYTNVKENKQAVADSAYVEEGDSGNHEHVYQEPEWEWKEYKAAMAVFTCRDCGEKLTLEAKITEEVKAATCGAAGENIYTASVERGGETYQDRKTVKGKKLPHATLDHVGALKATCTTPGNIEYWQCPACKKYFKEEGKTEILEKDVVIEALRHDYKDNWEPTPDYSTVTVALVCKRCNDTHTETVKLEQETTDATCITAGTIIYTAEVTYGGNKYSYEYTKTGSKGECRYGEPKLEWAVDDKVIATFTCDLCGVSAPPVEAEKVTEKEVIAGEGCKTPRKVIYTVKVTFNKKPYTGQIEKEFPAGHRLVEIGAKTPTCMETGYTQHWKCSECGTLFSDAAGNTETTEAAITLSKTNHDIVPVGDGIYKCTMCDNSFTLTQLPNGTTVVQSLEEGIALPLQPAPEEEQEEPAPQNAEESDDRNEDGQNVEEAQEAQETQGGQEAQNSPEEQPESDDGLTDAERYGLLYPEGEEPESDPAEGSWEENAVSLRTAAPESGMEQTAGEQQGYSLQISIAVLAVLAGAVLFFGLRKKNTI
ncbi:MAG: hypothetical protein NC302_08550 [Bacteroidales bacterium]|nr:hypothetical protein [Bacteroidales bacterium]